MRGKIVLGFVMVLFIAQLASAIDTEIQVKTIPDHQVQITAYDPGKSAFTAFETLNAVADEYGDAYLTFSSDEYEFHLIVYIKKDGDKIMAPQRFLDNFAGEPIYIEMAPSSFEFIETPSNETDLNQTNVTEENTTLAGEVPEGEVIIEEIDAESNDGATITGFAIGDVVSSKIFYYVIGIFALLIVVFTTVKLTQHRLVTKGEGHHKAPKAIKVRKLSDLKKEKEKEKDDKKEKIEDFKDIIEDAEKKIKEAQEEIRNMKERGGADEMKKKKQEKIDSIKQKMQDYERELLDLRKDE